MSKVILPEGYAPHEDEEYMNPMQLEYFRRKLSAWKEELIDESSQTINNLKEGNWREADVNDRATIETNANLELRTRNRYQKLIKKIEEALKKIESGDYGYCEDTGEDIGIKRLEARPIAALCIEAQERHESHEKQHNDDD